MSDLATLLTIAPPPAKPVGVPGDWSGIEGELGTALPADFKALVHAYGEGQFQDFLTLLGPFAGQPGPADQLVTEREGRLTLDDDQAAWVRARGRPGQTGDPWPPLFPEPQGLLPWAISYNGDRVCWRTHGPPESWTCVVWTPRDHYPGGPGAMEEHAVDASGLMARWLCRTLESSCLNVAVGPGVEGAWFEPSRDLDRVDVVLLASPLGAEECLRRLQRRLGVVRPRTVHEDSVGRQWRFLAGPGRWSLTYSWFQVGAGTPGVGHRLSIGYPPADDDAVREFIFEASADLDCDIRNVSRGYVDATAWLLGE